jgi:hypothetical protein
VTNTKFGHFIGYLDKERALVQEKRALLTAKKITYELLWFLFPIGSEVAFREPVSGQRRAGKVPSFGLLLTLIEGPVDMVFVFWRTTILYDLDRVHRLQWEEFPQKFDTNVLAPARFT